MAISLTRRTAIAGAAVAALATTAVTVAMPAEAGSHHAPKPTIVLVHGAFADSSSWNGVIERLRRDGYPVRAVANPLRGVANDATYVKNTLATISGPVVLVGHSYGGAVITNAAAGEPDVKSLVYIAAFAPATGESLAGLGERPVDHPIDPLPLLTVPTPETQGADLYVDPAQFRAAFAADVDRNEAADMAVAQRPIAAAAFGEPSAAEAWKSIPSWTLITKQDKAINPELQRFMATRAKAHTTEVNASHAVMVSHPDAVTRVIEQAAR
ncbi:alpha/beta fold hydrolase [Winogradskya humida]|uniref:Alpha/beta hydrolase n=1 Tax=Winogradskya humida TaxID=113566 RepID=A0ABQ3ZTB3_9ACTN|nr:alpha/beta hydrolase [Actinoplanes humidus]GIE21831.1 alpha/beta hydrolase [Actinoplanes humidus]